MTTQEGQLAGSRILQRPSSDPHKQDVVLLTVLVGSAGDELARDGERGKEGGSEERDGEEECLEREHVVWGVSERDKWTAERRPV